MRSRGCSATPWSTLALLHRWGRGPIGAAVTTLPDEFLQLASCTFFRDSMSRKKNYLYICDQESTATMSTMSRSSARELREGKRTLERIFVRSYAPCVCARDSRAHARGASTAVSSSPISCPFISCLTQMVVLAPLGRSARVTAASVLLENEKVSDPSL